MPRPPSLRRRLEAILGRPRPEPEPEPTPAPAAPAPIVFGRRPRPKATAPPTVPGAVPVVLARAAPGTETETPFGPAYVLEADDPGPDGARAGDLFVDIEATGLSNSPLFLIGVMTARKGGLCTRQFLARDYSEEAAAIWLFLEAARAATRLVSFNGKSYDFPYIRMRAAATGVPFDLDLPHLDLLHRARAAGLRGLPDYRLQTLERELLDRPRAGEDIPGAEIPDAYHAFVRTGDAADLVRILTHNRLDLVSLAWLLDRLT